MDGQSLKSLSLSLVIPAFNEAEGIGRAVAEAVAALARFTQSYEVIVVDDGRTDGTASLVAQLAAQNSRIRLLKHGSNKGYGAALRMGFEAAKSEFVAFTDADCQFDLSDLEPLLALAAEHRIAVGYRQNRQDPALRRFYSWGYNQLVRALLGTGVRDCDCALKVFRRDVLSRLLPTTDGFFVNAEMLTRARFLDIQPAQRAVLHRPRLRGVSKVSLFEIPPLTKLIPFSPSPVSGNAADAQSGPSDAILGTRRRPGGGLPGLFGRLALPLQEPEESRYARFR